MGIRVRNIQLVGRDGHVDLYGPKGLWITYGDEFSRTWGRAILERCYQPWFDKASDGGALDLRRLRNFKDAWVGDQVRYPLKRIRLPDGSECSGRDLAREIGENRMSGAPVFLPSTRDQKGEYEWDYTPPTSTGGETDIMPWIGDLDWDILDGLLVPREVVEASTTGSGFSGRSVPLVGFLAVRDIEFGHDVRQVQEQTLKPIALVNYGDGADDFDLVPTPLIETTGDLMGGMGQPDTSHSDGGDGTPSQPGSGQPQPAAQIGGGQGMQFGAMLWDEDEHPRNDDGEFRPKSGGATAASDFRLTNARKGKQRFENVKAKQKKLLEGMDALPGQQDLFDAPLSKVPIEKETYTTFKHPEEGHIDLRRIALHGPPRQANHEIIETYKDEFHRTPVPDEATGRKLLAKRIEELSNAGWRKNEQDTQFSTADDSGHWITIGAVTGGDGKKHGGTPVKIVGGKIVSGPKRLRGKSIKRLAAGKPNHNVEYRRAIKKAVKEHGVKEQDLHDAVEFVHGERKIHHEARESAKEDARKLTGLTAGDVSRLSNAGHDYASGKKAGGLTGEKLRHFDEFAQELSKSHPELGLGDSDDAAGALWNVLAEGKRSMLAKHDPEVIDEAVRLIHASGGRHYEDADLDAVPFSVDENGREHLPAGTSKGGEFPSKDGNDSDKEHEDPIQRKTKARVTVARSKRAEARKVVKAIGIEPDDIPSLVGASHGARVHIISAQRGILEVETAHRAYSTLREIGIDKKGQKFIYNVDINVGEDFHGQGIGTRVFARQVHHAAKAGFSYIKAHCAQGPRADGGSYNGYYTWALLGYDAPIGTLELPLQKKIRNRLPRAKTVQDVVQSKGGKKWWHAHGRSFDGTFDLATDSRSRRILDHYVKHEARTPPEDI